MRIVLTGTPGTGKTSLASGVAALVGGGAVEVGAFAKSRGLLTGEKGFFGEDTVDLKAVAKALAGELKGKAHWVVEGHLACEFKLPADAVVVLRCDPRALRKRLEARGYPEAKVRENVLAELLDYCLVRAEHEYGKAKVIQLDATKPLSANKIISSAGKLKGGAVDWSKQLLDPKELTFLIRE